MKEKRYYIHLRDMTTNKWRVIVVSAANAQAAKKRANDHFKKMFETVESAEEIKGDF